MDPNRQYPSQTGPTAGQAVRHPVESAQVEYDRLAGPNTGTYGTGGTGNIGTTTAPTAGVGEYGASTGTGPGLSTGTHPAGHHHHHHHHGDQAYAGTGTHVPGTGIGTGEGQLGSTGRGGVGNIGAGTAAGTGAYTGPQTGAYTGGVTDTGARPSVGDKIKGKVEVVAGKVTNDPDLVAEGEQRKAGTHPDQVGGGRPI